MTLMQGGSIAAMEGCTVEAVGSRVTCNPAPTNTDADFLVWTRGAPRLARVSGGLRRAGFVVGGSVPADMSCTLPSGSGLRFLSYRLGVENVILTADAEFYRRFMAATDIAKRFNLLVKADRVALFQAVLYGNSVA